MFINRVESIAVFSSEILHNFLNVILVDLRLAEENEVNNIVGREVFEVMNISGDTFNVPGDNKKSFKTVKVTIVWCINI